MGTTRVVVIGAGPGGYVAAVRAAQLGADVTIIEKENVGGTCLNWGCIPSKILISTAEMIGRLSHPESFGIRLEGRVKPDMPQLMARKEAILQVQRKGIQGLLQQNRIRYILGNARIQGQGALLVKPVDDEPVTVPWDRLIVAAGTQPMSIPSLSFDGERVISSNDALCLNHVPESIVIVGGGVIGCEFACLLSNLGSNVTVVEALDRLLPLPSIDAECSKILQREMKKKKINVMVNKTVAGVKFIDGKIEAAVEPSPFLENPTEKDRRVIKVMVDKVLVCIGRKPNSDDLGLETIGVTVDPRGWVMADDSMRTSADNVYAIGDILGPPKIMLAHVASAEGEVAAENAMGQSKRMAYTAVPSAIFTAPEVADAGLTEAQAMEQDLDCRVDSVMFRSLGKSHVIGEIAGQAKIVSDSQTGRIVGVHIIGAHATELIAEATLAIRMEATVGDLAATIHAHPTLAEIMAETAFKALGRPVHG
jgi:dihydrolipoamide dehydrogenase